MLERSFQHVPCGPVFLGMPKRVEMLDAETVPVEEITGMENRDPVARVKIGNLLGGNLPLPPRKRIRRQKYETLGRP